MTKEEFYKQLVHRYVTNQATEEELESFFHLLETGEINATLEAYLKEEAIAMAAEETKAPSRRSLWPRIAVAASLLIALSTGGYFLLHKAQQQLAMNQQHDIAPGHNQATLTLASGQKIVLTKGLSGQLATQGNMQIKVNAGNAIAYVPQNTNTTIETVYNTLSTVRGQESPYPLVLSDGTKVWLNAESSITYPVAFNGKERSVKITGEAYFEVIHNAAQPFKVEVKGQTIEDLGTTFDINAYDDEPNMKTTLISGSVRINHTTTLKPGQVAIQKGTAIKIRDVDTEGATAWKNGYFLFDKEDLPGIMRKISRWYDVDVEYPQGQDISAGFLGSVTRYGNVSKVLHMLETTGDVKFKIEGKKIIVTKK